MAKVTWLGEDELHTSGNGPSGTTAFGMKFPKDKAVEVTDPDIVARAEKNLFFRVDREAVAKPVIEQPADDQVADDEEHEAHDEALDGLSIAKLREMADAKGIDHSGMSKPQLREALRS